MKTRKNREKRFKLTQDDYVVDFDKVSVSSHNDLDDEEETRKSRIRDSNKEFARRMTILQSWSEYWNDYTTREGDAYPQQEARAIIKRAKKIACPITPCGKTFTSIGGLKYHYARCNIERSFKCIVCKPPMQLTTRGELLRHMILHHYKDLPSLDADQKEIANSYLGCEPRIDKTKKDKRKISADTEASSNGQRLVKAYSDLRNRIFVSESFACRPYKDWQSFVKDWELVTSGFDRRKYYPPESESVHFKLQSNEGWAMIKTGESTILSTDERNSPTSAIFYTGGINTASAWLPKSLYDEQSNTTPDLIAVSVNCCSMDHSHSYKESRRGEGCIQFWTIDNIIQKNREGEEDEKGDEFVKSEMKISLSYMIGHNHGTIFDMTWCPLGASWQPQVNTGEVLARIGLLALACGDGQIRILSVPHTSSLLARAKNKISENTIEATPIFKVKPIASLIAPGVGSSTDYQPTACKSICWNIDNNQRLIVAGYANGNVALFDLANNSPILYTNVENHHIYQPMKSWVAHGAPVTGVAISSNSPEKTLIATGSFDRQLKIWNPADLNSCLTTDRSPITKIIWDFRYRGVITATDTAFTSFNNRVSYRYPTGDGNHNITVSVHRSTVWGLANSIVTNAIVTSDGSGEVFIMPQIINRSWHKRDRNLLSTHSLYTMLPQALNQERSTVIKFASTTHDLNGNQEPNSIDCGIEPNLPDPKTNLTEPEQDCHDAEQNCTEAGQNQPAENFCLDAKADFNIGERPIANKPTKFLLPIEHRAVETYSDFKANFGLEFIQYNFNSIKSDSKLPESCIRASDTKNIYCDRPCDYPFSSINMVSWSPNANTFPYLLSATHVGLCRIDKVEIVEQIFAGYVDSILNLTANDQQ